MIRGTTPEYVLEIEGRDLTGSSVFVTVRQNTKVITKTDDDITVAVNTRGTTPITIIELTLSQNDTLALKNGEAEIQVRWIDQNGKADATKVSPIKVEKVLLERVIENGTEVVSP